MPLTALGQAISYPTVSALISRNADPRRQGQIMDLNNATGAMARVLGPLALGMGFTDKWFNAKNRTDRLLSLVLTIST